MKDVPTTQNNITNTAIHIGKKVLSLTARILIELIEQQEDLSYLYFHRVGYGRSVREARYEHERYQDYCRERDRKQAIKRLKERKYIKLRKEGDRVIVELTKNGKIKALREMIQSSGKYYSDGRMCLVSFDFPEAARQARNNFRLFLKRMGFKYVQGSVWSINKDIPVQMRELIRLLKIVHWVEVYTVVK